LTVEWSTLGNPDFLLAGCHDGTVISKLFHFLH
jgi:general transcription factor 3C polypeptide 2